MGKLILVTGGARSGKSGFAEKLAASYQREVVYVATAQAFDQEMRERIKLHQASRPGIWETVEEPLEVQTRIVDYIGEERTILLDCITIWISNLLLRNWEGQADLSAEIMSRIDRLISVVQQGRATLICVSNEVGSGIVPENKLGRIYRDLAGKVNQKVAQAANEVYLVTAGYPLEIKAAGSAILARLEGC